MNNEHVFALDIGTQSVTGTILKKNEHSFQIVDLYTAYHDERTMIDGQIQHVVEVAAVIEDVKKQLEKNNGPLHHVCVAAAGRALKTMKATASIDITEQPIRTAEEIKHLELSAVQQAQAQLSEEMNHSFRDYHCVGYSVLHYKLDGEIIGSFIDQVGEEASVEVIATFLPKIVVESLIAALERANLKMEALTLEPIAAIDVLVPDSMRRLNVALIDIGAGTSDIAITKDGTVIAYGMVPVAGDEITEVISDHYLLDFKLAEALKRTVVNEKTGSVQDILGFDVEVTYEELCNIINERVEHLAKLLAEKIKTLNSRSPQAIMLIGGGSLTPMLDQKLAHYLDLPPNRVAIRGTEAIQTVEKNDLLPIGPEFVTPIGIALSATKNPFQYKNIYVNGKSTFMFMMKQLSVGDCLIQAGIEINDYYGKIGLAYIINLNGRQVTLPGSYGKAPQIFVNDQEATVDTIVNAEDQITIVRGTDGRSPTVTLKQLVGDHAHISFTFNGERVEFIQPFKVNGQIVDENYIVKDNDKIETEEGITIHDFFKSRGIEPLDHQAFIVTVNENEVEIEALKKQLFINDKIVSIYDRINNNDHIVVQPVEKVTVATLLNQLEKELYHSIEITFNGQPVTLQRKRLEVKRDDKTLNETDELFNRDEITIKEQKYHPFIFQDVFRYIDIDVTQISGSYELYRNDEKVSFHDQIRHGDRLQLKTN